MKNRSTLPRLLAHGKPAKSKSALARCQIVPATGRGRTMRVQQTRINPVKEKSKWRLGTWKLCVYAGVITVVHARSGMHTHSCACVLKILRNTSCRWRLRKRVANLQRHRRLILGRNLIRRINLTEREFREIDREILRYCKYIPWKISKFFDLFQNDALLRRKICQVFVHLWWEICDVDTFAASREKRSYDKF